LSGKHQVYPGVSEAKSDFSDVASASDLIVTLTLDETATRSIKAVNLTFRAYYTCNSKVAECIILLYEKEMIKVRVLM
jgi:hypothetical protein